MFGLRKIPALAVGLLVAVTLFVVPRAPLEAQDSGFLVGIVVDELSGQPLEGAKVSLLGGRPEAVTDEHGQFLLEGVPVGTFKLRFEAPGFMSIVEEMELSAVFLQVRLSPVAAVLDELLVIAGRSRPSTPRGELKAPTGGGSGLSVLDLLERVPGVVVNRGGALGTGAYVYIRGVASFSQDNAPDVYLDGVKIESRNTGPRAMHILDQIPAEAVARVRVLKGASGAAAFALGGANGVILIETHRR